MINKKKRKLSEFSSCLTKEALKENEARKRLNRAEGQLWMLRSENNSLRQDNKRLSNCADSYRKDYYAIREMSVWQFFLCKIGWNFWP